MLETEICQMKMKNPTVLAAGVLGSTASSLNWVARSGAGAVIIIRGLNIILNSLIKSPVKVGITYGVTWESFLRKLVFWVQQMICGV